MAYAIEMLNITKDFPGIRANDNVTLQVEEHTVHALLGENGAGKSTIMSILFGLYQPTSGCIRIRGKEVNITDPNVANSLGIGMVHQHFKLVECFTVTENIVLGMEPHKNGILDLKSASKRIKELSEMYGLNVDQTLGIFVHIACVVERILSGGKTHKVEESEKIILALEDDYRAVTKTLKRLEKAFKIIIDDHEIATIIKILKQI